MVHSPRHDVRGLGPGHWTTGPGLRVLRLGRLARGRRTHHSPWVRLKGGGGWSPSSYCRLRPNRLLPTPTAASATAGSCPPTALPTVAHRCCERPLHCSVASHSFQRPLAPRPPVAPPCAGHGPDSVKVWDMGKRCLIEEISVCGPRTAPAQGTGTGACEGGARPETTSGREGAEQGVAEEGGGGGVRGGGFLGSRLQDVAVSYPVAPMVAPRSD